VTAIFVAVRTNTVAMPAQVTATGNAICVTVQEKTAMTRNVRNAVATAVLIVTNAVAGVSANVSVAT